MPKTLETKLEDKTLETKLEEWLYLRKIYMGDADKALLVDFIRGEASDQYWEGYEAAYG